MYYRQPTVIAYNTTYVLVVLSNCTSSITTKSLLIIFESVNELNSQFILWHCYNLLPIHDIFGIMTPLKLNKTVITTDKY